MALADHVEITITADSLSIARDGFGLPLIVSHNADFAERVRFYNRSSEVADDFDEDSPEYLAAASLFSASPRPRQVAIGRATLPVTQRYTLSIADVRDSETYQLRVSGQGFDEDTVEYVADSATTEAEIVNGLVDALNAVTSKNYLAAFTPLVVVDDTFTAAADNICTASAHGLLTGDGPIRLTTSAADLPDGLLIGTDYWVIKLTTDTFSLATTLELALAGTAVDILDAGTGTHTLSDTASTADPSNSFTVTGAAAGDWFSIEVLDSTAIACYQNHADPTVATDLTAILAEDATWYWLITLYNSQAYVSAAADWAQDNRKLYVADCSDSRDLGTSTGTAGALDYLAADAHYYSAGVYHPAPDAFAAAAYVGGLAARQPGSWTGKFKDQAGVTVPSLNATQRANLVARHANFLESQSGARITSNGTTAAGPTAVRGFIDNVVNLDWIESDLGAGIFGALAGNAKVPRTDKGMIVIANQLRATMARGIERTIIKAADPAPEIDIPLISEMDDLLPRGVRAMVGFELQGAIHNAAVSISVEV